MQREFVSVRRSDLACPYVYAARRSFGNGTCAAALRVIVICGTRWCAILLLRFVQLCKLILRPRAIPTSAGNQILKILALVVKVCVLIIGHIISLPVG